MLYRFNDLLYHLNDIISRLNEIFFCFDFCSNFLVSISFLINIGKEMSLPGFRTLQINTSYPYLISKRQFALTRRIIQTFVWKLNCFN